MSNHAAALLTKSEAATLIGGEGHPVSISFINQLLGKRRLARVRISYKMTRIPKQSVLDYIASRTVEASQ